METKRLVTEDGSIVYYVNIDGPAYLPQGNKRQAQYYIFGIKYDKEQWDDRKKDTNGVPWYKTAAGKAAGARV